jgi:uncharacterized protein
MYFADEDLLYNPRLRRAYRIDEGVPVMLAERAEPVPEREHERLITRARDGAAGLSAAGLARQLPGGWTSSPYREQPLPGAAVTRSSPYPVTASGGIAGPVSDGRSTPA